MLSEWERELDTPWLDRSLSRLTEFGAALASQSGRLSDPAVQRRIWGGLCAVALVWLVIGLAELIWSLVPSQAVQSQPGDIINPLTATAQRSGPGREVDIEELVSWPLFGEVDSPAPVSVELAPEPTLDSDLQGIEEGAEATRLPLLLAGIAWSSDQARARAMIEAKQVQAQYAPGDDLPVGNSVTVAKILPDRVVLDNNGNYELLHLFEDNERIPSKARITAEAEEKAASAKRQATSQRNRKIRQMADAHRQRQFGDPQKLAQIVNIAPIKEEGGITGYKLSAGRDAAQFEALGFRADDVVVAVNGIALTDPGKAVELFRVLHSASEADFELLRDGTPVTVSVALGESLGQ